MADVDTSCLLLDDTVSPTGRKACTEATRVAAAKIWKGRIMGLQRHT